MTRGRRGDRCCQSGGWQQGSGVWDRGRSASMSCRRAVCMARAAANVAIAIQNPAKEAVARKLWGDRICQSGARRRPARQADQGTARRLCRLCLRLRRPPFGRGSGGRAGQPLLGVMVGGHFPQPRPSACLRRRSTSAVDARHVHGGLQPYGPIRRKISNGIAPASWRSIR